MKKIVSIACVAMLGPGLAQAGGQSAETGAVTQEGKTPAAAACQLKSASRTAPANCG